VHALDRFSVEIRQGEIVAIIGGSGCGKSTLLRAVAGLDRATSGAVVLDDIAITAPHEKIGIIFQEPRLLPWLSVADNIGFGLSDAPANIRREKVARALQRVGLADKADHQPGSAARPQFAAVRQLQAPGADRARPLAGSQRPGCGREIHRGRGDVVVTSQQSPPISDT
jgi:ABC-type Fe3+/spermidine/putrescine transport system ATPase subunit